MKKKLFLFVTLLTLAVAGCGSSSNTSSSVSSETETKEIKSGTYEIAGNTFVFSDGVHNDVTGNWRLATTVTAGDVTDYAVEYYETLFSDNSEIHAIINKGLNTTNKINVLTDDLLNVTVYDYVTDEEKDAKTLFSGTVLAKYQITISTGEVEKIE